MDLRTSIACLLLGACTVAPAPDYQVTVRVESDPGVALAGASVGFGEERLGSTGAEGLAHVVLHGALGASVPLEVRCPEGYRQPRERISVILRASEPNVPAPEYAVSCPPSQRSLVVTVRAQNAVGVPLKQLGKELARTDARGAAHVLLKLRPGEDLTLVLDTSEHPELRPKSPTLKLTMPDRDEVVLFDAPFSVERAPAPKRNVSKPDLPERF